MTKCVLYLGFGFIASAALAAAPASAPKAPPLCQILLEAPRVDANATALAVGVYNRMAADFKALEDRAANSEDEVDVIAEFNAGSALSEPGPKAEATLTMVALDGLDDYDGLVSYGVRPHGSKPFEQSERVEVLGRLQVMANAAQEIPADGGESKTEFAKVFRGKKAIDDFVTGLGWSLARHVKKTIEINGEDPEEEETIFGIRKSIVPPSLFRTGVLLEGIWFWPGHMTLNFIDGVVPVTDTFNHGLTMAASFVHPTQVQLSQQWAYTAVVGAYGLLLAVKDLKNHFAAKPPAPSEPLPKPIPATPMGAQFDLVGWTLNSIVDGKLAFGPKEVMHWATNYSYRAPKAEADAEDEDFDMAFDLVLFVDQGEPVLLVTNRAI